MELEAGHAVVKEETWRCRQERMSKSLVVVDGKFGVLALSSKAWMLHKGGHEQSVSLYAKKEETHGDQ
eukprot:1158994-Pelagomonas_calceolata.AAC.3